MAYFPGDRRRGWGEGMGRVGGPETRENVDMARFFGSCGENWRNSATPRW